MDHARDGAAAKKQLPDLVQFMVNSFFKEIERQHCTPLANIGLAERCVLGRAWVRNLKNKVIKRNTLEGIFDPGCKPELVPGLDYYIVTLEFLNRIAFG